ncbi:MAG TPA: hypothetical protein PK511_05500 [Chitinophagales bacterium]|nr:BatD family protein [Chitinophagales bacterium]HMU68625.1 hypothetical protein [Chitinophagales bacterium]HMX03263.1 hypothetical protein [Chitinophagales bacterium]HMZ88055.1 hypothetical protein [Chitinophagales bacterium]HNA56591.1 hypothetical protein [Chitinophagales bacterium]
MKKMLSLIALSLIVNNILFSQDTLILKLNNPAPRVGQSVDLSMQVNMVLDAMRSTMDSTITFESTFQGGEKFLTQTLVFSDTGKHILGPFKFDINGKSYITNTLEINVAPELPLTEGIWIRVVENNGNQILIVEEQIKKSEPKSRISFGSKKSDFDYYGNQNSFEKFAYLNSEPEGAAIEFNRYWMQTYDSSNLSFFTGLYNIYFLEDSGVVYTLGAKDFINLPDNITVPTVVIAQ